MIYLDYPANTPCDERVLDTYLHSEKTYIGNPNSNHSAGKAAKAALLKTTESIASRLGVQPDEIIYTSGAREANNLAIKGFARVSRHHGKHSFLRRLSTHRAADR